MKDGTPNKRASPRISDNLLFRDLVEDLCKPAIFHRTESGLFARRMRFALSVADVALVSVRAQ